MGVYDTFGDVQIKAGECLMREYKIGQVVENIEDGIYVGYEGIVVIKNKIFIAEFHTDKIFNKWGGTIKVNLDDDNPIMNR